MNDAFRQNNYEAFPDFCADEVEWTIEGDRCVKGKENIRQWMKQMAEENPEPPNFSVVDPIIAEGDYVVAHGEMTMKDKDGRTGDYSYCDIYRFSDNKITELSSFVVKAEAKGKSSGAA